MYTKINNDTNLNRICDHDIDQNRQGQLCGQCTDNHSPSPYSYQLNCADCSNYKDNWIKYLLMAYLPLTAFFLAIIFFRINALSASMNATIFICQILSCPSMMSLISNYAHYYEKHPVYNNFNAVSTAKVLSTFYGVWNLDFFRMAYVFIQAYLLFK